MGASFTNVQVHTANRDPAEMRAIVAERLRQWMAQNSYEDLEEDGGEPDRTILVAPAGHEPWIAVYDEFTESQDERDLQELARVLSAATDGAAIAVLDHDSDILGLWLYRSGQLTDAYNSSPDFWGEVSPSEREEVVGRPDLWRDLLVPGASLDELAAAFARKDTFAEDTLLRLGDLLGLNPERIQVGFNDLEREYVTVTSAGLTRERPDLTGFARLPFRLTSGPALRSVAGLPNLHPGGGAIECTLAVDERLGVGEQHVRSASASNVGGPLKGLRIVFWGSALDDGLIEPEGASLVTRRAGATDLERLEVPLERGQSAGISFVHAILPDYELAAGIEGSGNMLTSLTAHGTSLRRLMAAEQTAKVTVGIRAVATKPGDGQLHVGFAPLANQTEGQTIWTFEIHVLPKPSSSDA